MDSLTQALLGLAIAFVAWQAIEAVLLVRASRKSEWHENPSLLLVDGKPATVLSAFGEPAADGWQYGVVSLRGETWRARWRASDSGAPGVGSTVHVVRADGLTLEVSAARADPHRADR